MLVSNAESSYQKTISTEKFSTENVIRSSAIDEPSNKSHDIEMLKKGRWTEVRMMSAKQDPFRNEHTEI